MDEEEEKLNQIEKRGDKASKIRYIVKTAQAISFKKKFKLPIRLGLIIPIIQDINGVKLFVKPVELDNKWSGFISKKGSIAGIAYNKNHPTVRQRFTVSHELGHLILNHRIKQDQKENISFKSRTIIEVEANIFAAELLIPKPLLKDQLKSGENIVGLSKIFWVSEEAMWFKIYNDNLISLI